MEITKIMRNRRYVYQGYLIREQIYQLHAKFLDSICREYRLEIHAKSIAQNIDLDAIVRNVRRVKTGSYRSYPNTISRFRNKLNF